MAKKPNLLTSLGFRPRKGDDYAFEKKWHAIGQEALRVRGGRRAQGKHAAEIKAFEEPLKKQLLAEMGANVDDLSVNGKHALSATSLAKLVVNAVTLRRAGISEISGSPSLILYSTPSLERNIANFKRKEVAIAARLRRTAEEKRALAGQFLNSPSFSFVVDSFSARNPGIPKALVRSEAQELIMRAAGNFNPSKGASWNTYATESVKRGLYRIFRRLAAEKSPVTEREADLLTTAIRLMERDGLSEEEAAQRVGITVERLRRIRERREETFVSLQLIDRGVAGGVDPAEKTDAIAARQVMEKALAQEKVTPREMQVARMRYLDGLTVKEIAEAIGRSPKTVEGCLGRVSKKIKAFVVRMRAEDERLLNSKPLHPKRAWFGAQLDAIHSESKRSGRRRGK